MNPNQRHEDSTAKLRDLLRNNRQSGQGGIFAVCSAHPAVIEAAVQQSLEDGSILLVESTSSQVNQFGGYTGLTPSDFAKFVHSAARTAGLPTERVLLGGDHTGPFPWRQEVSASALRKAGELLHDCVVAGYKKIHLDASMPCGDDKGDLTEQTIARRAAVLCQAAEEAYRELPSESPQLVYVIGTEVPAPGGESVDAHSPVVTKAEDAHRTLEAFRLAFEEVGLSSVWERVIALVVQPGVDFGSSSIFDYDRGKARSLSAALSKCPRIVFEAHSTDYQSPQALARMVEDHFAILKVGPWLTFAFREAVLALSAVERELYARSERRISRVRETLEAAMLRDPGYWRSYYHGDEEEVRLDLTYGYSDRCRYYWNGPSVQEEITRLLDNLRERPIPLTLVSQYLPQEYEAIRSGELQGVPERLIEYHIRRVLRVYADACSVKQRA